MRWISQIFVFYSLVRNYVKAVYSILSHMIIPHKVFIRNTQGKYDFEILPREQKPVIFSNVEKEILLQLIEDEKDAIETTTFDAHSLDEKRQAWERIGKEFNSYEETLKRSIYQLRNWWTGHKKQSSKTQRKQITYEQIGEGISNKDTTSNCSPSKEIVLAKAHIENLPERPNDSLTMDKSAKYRENMEKLYDHQSKKEAAEKASKAHEEHLQDLQLREIEKRYELIEEESKLKLDILKLQLKQEQLKTIQAERDLEVQKQKNSILDLDIKQKKMDIEMREYLFKEKQLKASSKNNKHSV